MSDSKLLLYQAGLSVIGIDPAAASRNQEAKLIDKVIAEYGLPPLHSTLK